MNFLTLDVKHFRARNPLARLRSWWRARTTHNARSLYRMLNGSPRDPWKRLR